MISVSQAIQALFDLVDPTGIELCSLKQAHGRVLAQDAVAQRNQPPFAASSMDGYAVKSEDVASDATFEVIGEASAGHRFHAPIISGQAVRIFTGAPLPEGADRVIIQEDVIRSGDHITLQAEYDTNFYVRPAGVDFQVGATLSAPRRLSPRDIALLASMNVSETRVYKKPVVALISTGDELVMPGEVPSEDQIIASNTFGLYAQLTSWGAHPRILPIAKDNIASIQTAFDLASDADLIVTIGGASVGDHDLVGAAARAMGLEQKFYKVRMRPGKPLMSGVLGGIPLIGLPGNPVSAMVCGEVFLKPVIDKMMGLPAQECVQQTAILDHDIGQNGDREHYMRARLSEGKITVFDRQDSALLSVLSDANALVVRAPDAAPQKAGDHIQYIPL